MHALGGCYTVHNICFFGLGKSNVFTHINNNAASHKHCMTLQCATTDVAQVASAGIEVLMALCGGKVSDKLESL